MPVKRSPKNPGPSSSAPPPPITYFDIPNEIPTFVFHLHDPNVEQPVSTRYRRFITGLRGDVKQDNDYQVEVKSADGDVLYSREFPILPISENGRPTWFIVRLTVVGNEGPQVEFLFCKEDLYILAFRQQGGKWLQLSLPNTSVIPDSIPLPVSGSYGGHLDKLQFGLETIEHCLHWLAQTQLTGIITPRIKSDCEENVHTIIIILAESLRFTEITDFVAEGFHNNLNRKLRDWYPSLFRSWDHTSDLIQNRQGLSLGKILELTSNIGILKNHTHFP